MSGDAFVVLDDQGLPVGMASRARVTARGDQLAFDLAAVCDKPDRLRELLDVGMAEGGSREFGYVSQAALIRVIEDIVRPMVVAAEFAGVPVWECLARSARAAGAACPVCGHWSHELFELFGFQVQCSPDSSDERGGAL